MGPVPVMRGLLAQPRATVQDDGSKRAGDRAGSRRQAPGTQRLPAHPIMTEPSDTGTHHVMPRPCAGHPRLVSSIRTNFQDECNESKPAPIEAEPDSEDRPYSRASGGASA